MNTRLHQLLCGSAGMFVLTFFSTYSLFSQTYRPERWQDGRPLRQGKFLIAAGWGFDGIGYTVMPEMLTSNPPQEPTPLNPSFGTYTVAASVGVAPMIDFGVEFGGTWGGGASTFFGKYAFMPYSSPFQVALLLSAGYSFGSHKWCKCDGFFVE